MSTPTGSAGGDQPDYGSPQPGGSQAAGYGASSYPAEAGGHGGGPPQQPRNGFGITALVLGIIGLILVVTIAFFYIGAILCILAIIFGALGRSRVKKGEATNGGVAMGGLVTGIIGLVILIVGAILAVTVGLSFYNSNGGPEYTACVQQANNDQAKIQECAQRFSQKIQQNNN